MSDIFISYAREDQPRAEMLAQILAGHGWLIFWDRTIPIGKTWREIIGSELDDARCIIVLWSKISIKSGWVQDEADEAKRRGVLVPILIENVQPPMGFRSIQAAQLQNWDGTESTQAFRRLIADIAVLIGPPPEGERAKGPVERQAEEQRKRAEAEIERKAEEARQAEEQRRRAETEIERKAADEPPFTPQDASAMYSYGERYFHGQEVAQDYAKAREFYEKAANMGDAEAMCGLGVLYFNGQGVAQDYAKAGEWYEKAAAKGNVNAMFGLARLYENDQKLPSAKSREWYEKAADEGNATAMVVLGALYDYGQGVAQDYAKARGWYEKAANMGDTGALISLGRLYDKGLGVAQDYAKARECYEKAAAEGDARVQTMAEQHLRDLQRSGLLRR